MRIYIHELADNTVRVKSYDCDERRDNEIVWFDSNERIQWIPIAWLNKLILDDIIYTLTPTLTHECSENIKETLSERRKELLEEIENIDNVRHVWNEAHLFYKYIDEDSEEE